MPKLGNLASRFLVAVVAVPILLAVIYKTDHRAVFALVFAASLIAMMEFFKMTLEDTTDQQASLMIGAGASVMLYWGPQGYSGTLALVVLLLPSFLYYLFRFGDMKTVASRMTATVTGSLYAGILFMFLPLLYRLVGQEQQSLSNLAGHTLIFVLATAWFADTAGYFCGRFLGKRKLYEAVSPKKTWAGAVGGLAGSALAGVLFKVGLGFELPWHHVMLMAIPGGMLGQMGDLCESLIKRSTGVKDSGTIIPGHGGILDRVDAVLFIAPYYYLYLVLLIRGV